MNWSTYRDKAIGIGATEDQAREHWRNKGIPKYAGEMNASEEDISALQTKFDSKFTSGTNDGGDSLTAAPEMGWGETLSKAIDNSGESLLNVGKGAVSMVAHPVDTVNTLHDLASGLMLQASNVPLSDEQERMKGVADTVIDHYKETFGSLDGFKRALAKDPASILMDVSAFAVPAMKALGVGGKAVAATGAVAKTKGFAKAGGTLEKLGGAVEQTAKAAGTATSYLDPLAAANNTVRAGVKLIPDEWAPRIYANVAKFRDNLTGEARIKLAKFGLDKKIDPTHAGIEKLTTHIDGLAKELNAAVDTAVAGGAALDPRHLRRGLKKLEKQMIERMPTSNKKIKAKINDIIENLNLSAEDIGKMSPESVHWYKVQLNRELASFFEDAAQQTINNQTAMALRGNAVNFLETVIPNYKALNEKWGLFAELEAEILKTARSFDHSSIMAVRPFVAAGIAKGVAGPVAGAAAGAASLMQRPGPRLLLAKALHKLNKVAPRSKVNTPLLDALMTAPERLGLESSKGSPDTENYYEIPEDVSP